MKRIGRIVFGVLLVLVASCGSDAANQSATPNDLFGAVAAHRVFVANTFDDSDVFEEVRVVSTVGQPSSDGVDVRFGANDRDLTPQERQNIVSALAPKPVTFVPPETVASSEMWIAVLLFAEPRLEGNEAVVTTSVICGSLCGTGGAQQFELDTSGWQFVQNVGPQWIS